VEAFPLWPPWLQLRQFWHRKMRVYVDAVMDEEICVSFASPV
jgi:hypothetical protein